MPAGRLDGPGRLPRAGRVEIGADHRGALGAEPERGSAPDPRAGARHDRDLSVHAHVGSSAVRTSRAPSGRPTIANSATHSRETFKWERWSLRSDVPERIPWDGLVDEEVLARAV